MFTPVFLLLLFTVSDGGSFYNTIFNLNKACNSNVRISMVIDSEKNIVMKAENDNMPEKQLRLYGLILL